MEKLLHSTLDLFVRAREVIENTGESKRLDMKLMGYRPPHFHSIAKWMMTDGKCA